MDAGIVVLLVSAAADEAVVGIASVIEDVAAIVEVGASLDVRGG